MARKDRCFIIMPFHKDFQVVWDAIKKAGKRFKYLTIDHSDTSIPSKGQLFQEIKEKIATASFVIADFSLDPRYRNCPNPNVMTEAGFALGKGNNPYIISRKPISPPSDWSQVKIADYNPKDPNLDDWFEKFFEKIMLEHEIDTQRAELRRNTQGEKLNWLISIVQELRSKAKETYEMGSWSVGSARFSPNSYSFSISSELPPSVDQTAFFIEVYCGVYFSEWDRRESPFRIKVRFLNENKKQIGNLENHEIKLSKSIEIIRNEQVWEAFEEKLDSLLPSHVSKLTPLANAMQVMPHVVDGLKCIQIPGSKLLKKGNWSNSGHMTTYCLEVDQSPILFFIDFQNWEEHSTPYWIKFQPHNPNGLNLQKFKGAIIENQIWNIPIEAKKSPEEIIKGYTSILVKIMSLYKPSTLTHSLGTQEQYSSEKTTPRQQNTEIISPPNNQE
ncbi:hypothetical protein [Candidatus Uabimicrobium sp. HlEnr_7]|uniref:hypothetical protein n=1 Tax=Candidatus Uabimicrobium helgolandensis TaxID=3095367 RepID=UPI003555FF8D